MYCILKPWNQVTKVNEFDFNLKNNYQKKSMVVITEIITANKSVR